MDESHLTYELIVNVPSVNRYRQNDVLYSSRSIDVPSLCFISLESKKKWSKVEAEVRWSGSKSKFYLSKRVKYGST